MRGVNGIAETGIGYSNRKASDSEATMHSTGLPFLPLSLVIGLLTLTPGYATEYQLPSDKGRQQQADAQGSRRKGAIRVRSQVGEYTEFEIIFPKCQLVFDRESAI